MACQHCPFAMTAESESVQNLGCLPSPYEIMTLRRELGRNWACHEDETRPCAGQARWCAEDGIPFKNDAPLLSYHKWYHEGYGSELDARTEQILLGE